MMTEEQLVEALCQGVGCPRGSRPQRRPGGGAAFGIGLSQPSWARPPYDYAARANREATGELDANAEARLMGQVAAGREPAAGESYDPLQNAVNDYRRQQEPSPLYRDGNGSNPGNPVPPPAGPTTGRQALLHCFSALLKGLFNVNVPPANDPESFYLSAIGPLTQAVCARAGAAGQPGDPLAEARRPKLPLLLQAAKEEGQPELRQSAPEWQQRAGR